MFKKIMLTLTLVLSIFALSACKEDEVVVKNTAPKFAGETSVSLQAGDTYDPKAGVTANDTEDGDLTSSIVVKTNPVDTSKPGVYTVVLTVTDSGDLMSTFEVTVNVAIPLASYLSGVDLSKLKIEDKDILFAALESYLLENVYAGVPLYNGASRVMYADRVQLYSPTYNGVMGFGTGFSQFSLDDSNVEMYDGVMGEAGEYTWRASFNTDPTSLNPWISDDSNSTDFIDMFTGGLYEMHFDASKTGYQIDPSLAASDPTPEAGTVETVNGKDYSKVWLIELRDDLVWTFHEDIDTSGFATGFETLDASDYLWTWQHALTESWFRAKTGGGDFISHGVKNAAEFIAGTVTDVNEVGLSVVDGNTLRLEFVTDKSEFDIKYMFAGASLSPINQELFESLGDTAADRLTEYGKGPDTVASSGKYIFDVWTPGQLLTFVKNENHPDSDLYHYTGYQYRYISGTEQIFAEFLAGRLESAAVPSAEVVNYASDPRVNVAPDPTTWRLMINGFGTTEARDAYIEEYPEVGISDTYVPEPILMYTEMRQALYYGFDRKTAAIDVVQTYLPQHTLFASTYFLDGESGVSVRTLDAGQGVVDNFAGASNGYVKDAAIDLFKDAVAMGIADGYYTAGTADAYTVIELNLKYASSGSTSAQAMLAELEKQYEEVLMDGTNFVKVDIVVEDVAFPDNYYDYMMPANCDLGIGGISGSLLDAPSFLDVYNDNNAGGFTLNWGIDTTTPNITVTYNNLAGEEVTEIWGYNALVAAFNGNTYISKGLIQENWDSSAALIDAYLDMAGEVKTSATLDTEYAAYILGSELTALAETEEVDELVATVVVTESGKNVLYVVQKDGNEYSIYGQYTLYTDVDLAMTVHSGGYVLGSSTLLVDDAAVVADAYLTGDYATLAEIATANGVPLEFMEVYSVTWADDAYSGTDAYVVLHINDYFIPIAWL